MNQTASRIKMLLLAALTLFHSGTLLAEETGRTEGLYATLIFTNKQQITYRLDYQTYPIIVKSFAFFARSREPFYTMDSHSFAGDTIMLLGRGLVSKPALTNTLPPYPAPPKNSESSPESSIGLGFMRLAAVTRADSLIIVKKEADEEDLKDLILWGTKQGADIEPARGIQTVLFSAEGPDAENFLESLPKDQDSYLKELEAAWLEYLNNENPDVAKLIDSSWKREPSGIYKKNIQAGSGDLPKTGENVNMTIQRRSLSNGSQLFEQKVILNIGRDSLPPPLSYYISKIERGSTIGILYPPSRTRQLLSTLDRNAAASSKYKWLFQELAASEWLYLTVSTTLN